MCEKSNEGIIPIINQITEDFKEVINDVNLLNATETQAHTEELRQRLIKNLNKLTELGQKVDKTSILIQSVILSIHSSRNELKKSVEGLIQKTGMQLQKVTSTTEEATNKIMDVAEKLDEEQMNIIEKIDELAKKYNAQDDSEIEDLKQMVYSNQDKAFTIMDYLQFQDITAQQISGAYALLADTEKTLVYVSELLREFDDKSKEEQIKRSKIVDDRSFNADAKFVDKTKLQNAIDELFASGNIEVDMPDEADETDIEGASQKISPEAAGTVAEASVAPSDDDFDIDALFAQNKKSESQDDIDKLFSDKK